MLPKLHILYGLVFAYLIYILSPITIFQAALIFLSSFLIDVDHYIFYVQRKKDLSLFRAYKWFIVNGKRICKQRKIMVIFHTVEALVLVTILAYFFNIFIFILIGMLFHLFLDFVGNSHKDMFYIRYLILRKKHPSRYF